MLEKYNLGKDNGLEKYILFFLINTEKSIINFKRLSAIFGDRIKLKYILDVVNHYLDDLSNSS